MHTDLNVYYPLYRNLFYTPTLHFCFLWKGLVMIWKSEVHENINDFSLHPLTCTKTHYCIWHSSSNSSWETLHSTLLRITHLWSVHLCLWLSTKTLQKTWSWGNLLQMPIDDLRIYSFCIHLSNMSFHFMWKM